jgi:hypothetical protein
LEPREEDEIIDVVVMDFALDDFSKSILSAVLPWETEMSIKPREESS